MTKNYTTLLPVVQETLKTMAKIGVAGNLVFTPNGIVEFNYNGWEDILGIPTETLEKMKTTYNPEHGLEDMVEYLSPHKFIFNLRSRHLLQYPVRVNNHPMNRFIENFVTLSFLDEGFMVHFESNVVIGREDILRFTLKSAYGDVSYEVPNYGHMSDAKETFRTRVLPNVIESLKFLVNNNDTIDAEDFLQPITHTPKVLKLYARKHGYEFEIVGTSPGKKGEYYLKHSNARFNTEKTELSPEALVLDLIEKHKEAIRVNNEKVIKLWA